MLINEIRSLKENNLIEFKKAKGGLPKSLWESYSAFANTNGGVIVLGIDEPQKNMFISGKLTDFEVEELQKSFWDNINNSNKINVNILVDKDVYIDEYDGYPILVIKIRRANRFEKPVYINNNVYNGTYRRNHQGDYHCTKAEVDLMIKDSSNQSNDKTCLEEFTIEDFDLGSISSYKQMLKASNPSHIFLTMTDEQFYLNLGIIKKDKNGVLHPTRAGLLMFGKEYRITDEFSHYFLDYQDHRIETPEIRWIDRVQSSSGDWSGNVFDFFFKVYNKMIQGLSIPFKLDGAIRVDDTEMHRAVREALCNALTNADYYGTRGVVIKKYNDRIEFSNPGSMRMSIEEAYEGGNTDPRNETILKIFSLIKIGERAGTGIQTILNAVKIFGYRDPIIEESFNPDRTTLTIFLELKDDLQSIYSNSQNIVVKKLSYDEEKAFALFKDKKEITRKDLEESLKYGKTKCNNILKKLLDKGVILKIDSGKNIKYVEKN